MEKDELVRLGTHHIRINVYFRKCHQLKLLHASRQYKSHAIKPVVQRGEYNIFCGSESSLRVGTVISIRHYSRSCYSAWLYPHTRTRSRWSRLNQISEIINASLASGHWLPRRLWMSTSLSPSDGLSSALPHMFDVLFARERGLLMPWRRVRRTFFFHVWRQRAMTRCVSSATRAARAAFRNMTEPWMPIVVSHLSIICIEVSRDGSAFFFSGLFYLVVQWVARLYTRARACAANILTR